MERREGEVVCITGITGFLGSHVLKAFLDCFQPKFTIRGTVRNKDENEKLKLLEVELGRYFDRIEIVEADLNNPDSLDKAIEGCDYVVHTASPNPERNPEEYDQVVTPVVNGIKAVLEACRKHQVKRLVYTSTVYTIIDYTNEKEEFDEEDYINEDNSVSAHTKSKYLAENSIKEFIDSLPDNEKFEVVIINSGFIIGPLIFKSSSTSQEIITKVIRGNYPALPNIFLPVVDVRDVADAHLKGITKYPPPGKYILVEGTYPFSAIGEKLYYEFKNHGFRPTRKTLGYCAAKLASIFLPEAKPILQMWNKEKQVNNTKSIETLDIDYKSYEISLAHMGTSLQNLGFFPEMGQRYEEE